MQKRELRRMRREELVEIIYELKKELETTEQEKKQLEEQLETRKIQISEAGSIAEAALQLNGIFAAAQAAADDYLNNLKRMH